MFIFQDKVAAKDIGSGVLVQTMGHGTAMTVLRFSSPDNSVAPRHAHPHEQFGYVLKGALEISIGDETSVVRAGDCYLIPPNAPHEFRTIGETEALDVFSPVRTELPWDAKE
jgi:quercetin dioxygenase-like cupin family protein